MTNDEKQELIEQVLTELSAEEIVSAFLYTTDGLIQKGKEFGIEIPYPRIIAAIKRERKTQPRGPVLDGILLGRKWLISRKSGDKWLEYQIKKFKKSKNKT